MPIPYGVILIVAAVAKTLIKKNTPKNVKAQKENVTDACNKGSVQKCPNNKGGVKKLESQKVPCFKKNKKGSSEEYDKQLKDQQNGLNDLTAEEYLEGREAYSSVKRKSTTKDRNKFKDKLIDDYQSDGMSKAKATEVATRKMKTLHALHNPDLIAGGKDKVTTFGDKSVNQSIGSQWKTRVDDLDKAAEKALKEGKGKSKMNAVLMRCK